MANHSSCIQSSYVVAYRDSCSSVMGVVQSWTKTDLISIDSSDRHSFILYTGSKTRGNNDLISNGPSRGTLNK